MNAFLQQLAQLGAARLIVMFGIAAGVAAALMMVALRIGDGDKALLFSGLDLADVADVASRLDQANIGYELGAGGATIFVDADQVLGARMLLAADGLPGSGSVGYEIFDSQDALGSTQFVQNINRLRALEGELARTIAHLDGVGAARVHLAIPERRLFDRDASEPTASVFLDLRGDGFSARNARAVRNLVASAVPGLKGARVTILDGEGRLLHDGGGDDPEDAMALAMEDRRVAYEERLKARILDLVESVVGRGNARVQATAEMDFNRVTETEELYDPAGQVVRSTRLEEASSDERDADPAGETTADENVPALADDAGAAGPTSQAASNTTVEVINYEISKRTRNQIREVGAVTRLSVAVAVNTLDAPDEAEGDVVATPRSAEELAQIAALVRSAIGFDETRGDTVEVVSVAFADRAQAPAGTLSPAPMAFTSRDIVNALELAVLAVVAVMLILLVARPLLQAARPPDSGGAVRAGPEALEAASDAPSAQPMALVAPDEAEEEETIDFAQIDGGVKASAIKKVARAVQDHQEKSLAIMRGWLTES